MNLFLAGMDFALAAFNVYMGMAKSGYNAFSWAAAVFCFGMGFVQIAMYLKGR